MIGDTGTISPLRNLGHFSSPSYTHWNTSPFLFFNYRFIWPSKLCSPVWMRKTGDGKIEKKTGNWRGKIELGWGLFGPTGSWKGGKSNVNPFSLWIASFLHSHYHPELFPPYNLHFTCSIRRTLDSRNSWHSNSWGNP